MCTANMAWAAMACAAAPRTSSGSANCCWWQYHAPAAAGSAYRSWSSTKTALVPRRSKEWSLRPAVRIDFHVIFGHDALCQLSLHPFIVLMPPIVTIEWTVPTSRTSISRNIASKILQKPPPVRSGVYLGQSATRITAHVLASGILYQQNA